MGLSGASARARGAGPRIGLLGYMGAGNFGNDGSLEAAVQALGRTCPTAELSCFVAAPDIIAARTGLPSVSFDAPAFSRRWMRGIDRLAGRPLARLADAAHTLRHMRRLDAIMVPGTGILDDYGTGPRGMPSTLLRWVRLARACGVKVCLVSIGAGPIHDPRTRGMMREAARVATFRSYRDEASRAFVQSLGIDTRGDCVTPDIAFALPVPPRSAPASLPRSGTVIGLGVMKYAGWQYDPAGHARIFEPYLAKLTAFALRLLDRGVTVRLLTGALADWEVAEEVRARLARDRPHLACASIVADRPRDLADVMRQAARCDVVIATRFHNVVCALAVGRPVISVGYAGKNDQLLAACGLGDYCQHIERLDIDLLERQLASVWGRRPELQAGVEQAVAGFRGELAAQELRLLRHIGAPLPSDPSRRPAASGGPQAATLLNRSGSELPRT